MATKLDLQREILKELNGYCDKLITVLEQIIAELREGRKEDTSELFDAARQGLNWVIEVFNNCEDVINRDEQRVDKSAMVQAVGRLGTVLRENDDVKIAACLEVDFLPFLHSMNDVSAHADEICCQN